MKYIQATPASLRRLRLLIEVNEGKLTPVEATLIDMAETLEEFFSTMWKWIKRVFWVTMFVGAPFIVYIGNEHYRSHVEEQVRQVEFAAWLASPNAAELAKRMGPTPAQ